MAREPWELTQAFAEQLMRQAAQTEQQATRVQLAPIEQAMALDRLKQQGEIELSQLPKKLSIEDAAKIAPENRAYTRQKETEGRLEDTTIAGEQRKEEALPRTLAAQTDAKLKAARGDIELQMQAVEEYGKDRYEQAMRAKRGGFGAGRSAVTDYHRPPQREGLEIPKGLPKDIPQRKLYLKELENQGYDIVDIESAWGNDYAHVRKRPKPEATAPVKKEEVKSGPSLGRRLLEKLTGPPAPPVAGAAPTADKAPPPPEPVSTRSAGSLPFDSVGARTQTDLPASAKAIPSLIGDTRLPLPEMKGDPIAGKDKMSFLYESIRRRGYTDDEAKTILAKVIDKPETKPTDDPDVFDVLVA